MFGFRFEDDNEAYQFYETVMVRTKARRKSTFRFTTPHLIAYLPFLYRFPALVKPSSGPRSWSKSVRRRTTMVFAPAINQITDPEPGSFQHRAHVGIDGKGNLVAEGEVERRWSDFLSGPTRPKVGFVILPRLGVRGLD
jgi:hypothetical protein